MRAWAGVGETLRLLRACVAGAAARGLARRLTHRRPRPCCG